MLLVVLVWCMSFLLGVHTRYTIVGSEVIILKGFKILDELMMNYRSRIVFWAKYVSCVGMLLLQLACCNFRHFLAVCHLFLLQPAFFFMHHA